MGATWTQFYEDRVLSEGYRKYFKERYKPFLDEIRSYRKDGDRIVEVGCGIGTTTSILADDDIFCGYRCFDICPEMVAFAMLNTRGRPVGIGDARLPTNRFPDIVHSHGLLEHFVDKDIESVLNSHRVDGVRYAIHYVPGNLYVNPSFGDERLLPLEYWVDNFKPTKYFKFNDGYDYCLVWDLR